MTTEQSPRAGDGTPAAAIQPLPQTEFDALMDHIYEHGTMAEGITARARAMCEAYARAALAAAPAAAPAALKPLTDYQIVRIYERPELAGTRHESGTEKAIAIARAIEAAHGIQAPATVAAADCRPLKTSAEGRAAVERFFVERLQRHDFTDYIRNALAADFACVLGGYLVSREAAKP